MKKRILSILLLCCMVLTLLPTEAFAADTGKAIQLGTDALSKNANTATAPTVYFGQDHENNPAAWRVIGYNGNGVTSAQEDMTLLAAGNMSSVLQFGDFETNNRYASSYLKTAIDALAEKLTTEENTAVKKRTLTSGSYNGENTDCVAGEPVDNAVFWPLSTAEAFAVNEDLRIVDKEHPDWASSFWWLRSPGASDHDAATVHGNGSVIYSGNAISSWWCVRPAFNLNSSSVLFTSAAVGGKPDGGLTPISKYTGNEWKLTLKDSNRNFAVTETTVSGDPGDTVTLHYTGATAGINEYISVILADNSGAQYYGRVAQPTAENGTVEIKIPSGLAPGSYTLKVFSEQCNGDKKTDYASDFVDIDLTVGYQEQFTLTPGGTYYFDLSGAGIPGTANDALPDNTIHYVPFTYAGTVVAYKLTSEMATTEEYAQQNEYAHSLFVADYAVTHAVSWDDLNATGLIFGKGYATGSVDYTLRAPSGGSGGTGSGALERGTPQSNEWDRILDKDDGYIKNWRDIGSWGQDTLPNTLSNRVIRGRYDSPRKYAGANTTLSFQFLGFRPVLEVLNPGTLGSDGLKAVTLDLGGGKLGGSSDTIQIIVKTGESFTAPASEGLTRPDGDTGSSFKWLGSDGNLYAPGASVPEDVTTLTARFVPDTYTVIVTTDSLPDGKTGKAYSHTLTAIGAAPITWKIDEGVLPAGLNLNEKTGEISGIPTAAGTATFTVKAENSEGSDTRALSIIISNPVEQTPVRYLDADGKERFCTEYTVLESVIIEDFFNSDNKWYDMPAGWYVVEGDVTITPRLDTHGAVNLILTDDCHLTVPWGINVKEGDTFTIYAQSTAEASMGKLTACLPELSDHEKSVWPVAGLSGIGAGVRVWAANDNFYENEGTIIINGGNIHAKGQQASSAIGGSDYEHNTSYDGDTPGNLRQGGSITINGGTVKASSEGDGFGIGGAGVHHTAEMHITINGGNIETTANRNNAAIGDKSKQKSSVTINGGVIHAVGKGSAAGIGSTGDIRITGGEISVFAEGGGAAIGSIGGVDCKSITINGNAIKSLSSKDGACIGAATGGSVGSITISDAELPLLSSNKILIGWDADSPGGKLTIRNCRVESTDELTTRTDGIRVGSNSELVIENSEIRLPHLRGIRVGGNGSIAVRDSDLHTYGIFMDENAKSPNDAKTLKRLEITDSTVLTGDIIGARGEYSSVEEIVIRGSIIRLNDEYTYNRCTIGGGEKASFGSIDIQDSQIDSRSSVNAVIGNGTQSQSYGESRIRIANSQVSVRNELFGPAIGAAYGSSGGQINILIENSTVTAKGGNLRSGTDYIPGIGKNSSGRASEIGKIQILNSTVESFRLEEKDGTNYVYDKLHTKELPGIPAENITICGSTVNGKTIDHSPDEYGKCALCDKYDLGYCYEHGLLTLEGLTDCAHDGSEKKLTGLSHQTGENETKQLAENMDYTAIYSNNVNPYTLTPDDAGFDPEKAPKVTLYGTGNYCGKAEHYFTISESTAAAPTITTDSLPDGKVGEAYSQTLTADGTTPITWGISGSALPEGLTLNETTGEISGTPTAEGTAKFTVKAENSAGSDTKELSITITKDAPPSHEHSYGDWRKDGTSHWHECTDTDCPNREESITDKAAHVYTDDTDTTCDVCGYERTVTPPAPTEFIVTFDGNGGTPSVGSMTTTDQKLTSLPSASRSGSYSFDGWYTQKSGGTKITTDTVFSANTTVYAHWTYTGGGGGGYNPPVTYYTLRFETGGGSDIPSVRETYNAYIDLTQYVPTWRGHTFIGWYSERGLINKVSGVYLTKDMTVYAGWRVDENPNTGANPFTDVSEKDWFYGDVMFVYENGLMLGTSKTLFSPHGTATRGMMATILWRMEGSPVPKGKNSFTDVEAGKWYADATTWTAENSIFAGYGKDKFGPDDPITREQLAAIFYRYADYKGYDLTVKGNLDKFKDADKITDYAKTAMQWAVGSGLVKGKSGNLLDPQGTATRAEIAAMLHRFIEKYELVQGKAPGGLMGWIDPKRLKSQRPATAAR